ncbi:MAG: hypothetical protein WBP45_09535 [Daejeonella sp.]
MNAILNRNNFFLKKQTGLLSVTQRYTVYDPETKQQLMKREEPSMGFLKNILRLIGYTASIPFHITVSDMSGNKLLSVRRKFSFFKPTIQVFDENEVLTGKIRRSPWWTFLGDKFRITDVEGNKLCSFNDDLFWFKKGDTEFAGLNGDIKNHRAEFIDAIDEYKMYFKDIVPQNDPLRVLVFGAVMSVDLFVQSQVKKKALRGREAFGIDI